MKSLQFSVNALLFSHVSMAYTLSITIGKNTDLMKSAALLTTIMGEKNLYISYGGTEFLK